MGNLSYGTLIPRPELLTPRGWWFLVILLLLCGLGAGLSPQIGDAVAVVGLVLLAWFLWEWGQFVYRVHVIVPRLTLRRELSDERKVIPLLWAESEYDVRARVGFDGPGDLPYCLLADWIPTDGTKVDGSEEAVAAITGDRAAEIRYRLKCPVPGELRFEGVRLRVADRQGFFYLRTLVRDGSTYPVLPRLTGAEGQRRGTKRINIFPPPGVHRLKRPGGGSELLDLRDYIPGDPPKMIAWKPSARRDKLFTKEFESEVPVRCTLFVDASEGTRLGARRTKITRLANLAAGVAEAAVADRDHAGLVVFDETDSQVMRPKRSRRHVIDMLHMLSKACGRPTPIGPFADAAALAKLAYPLANELHPELMRKEVNSAPDPIIEVPLFWIRQIVLFPIPLFWAVRSLFWSPASDYRRGWWILLFWLPFLFVSLNYLARQVGFALRKADLVRTSYSVSQVERDIFGGFAIHPFGPPIGILNVWFITAAFAMIGVLLWIFHGYSGFLEQWRSERLRRKQLGVLFAALDGDRAGAESHYLHDDQVFARRAQRFLAAHHARYPVRLYDARGRYLFAGRPKLDVLVKALNYSVARGHDNELFVLLVDLVDLADDLDLLVRAVRVAVARHHQVLILLPWQEDVPAPPAEPPADDGRIPLRKAERFQIGGLRAIADQVRDDYVDAYHRAYFRLRRTFGKLGVLVLRADQEEPVQVVLDRLDRLRGVGRRR